MLFIDNKDTNIGERLGLKKEVGEMDIGEQLG